MSRWIILTATILFCGGCGGDGDDVPASAALIVEARQAIDAGDTTKAMESLDASIAAEPTAWAYALRARVQAEAGSDDAALADCDAGLKLDETNEELMWIKSELRKPKEKRFQKEVMPSKK